jgi:hypothetical protein
MTDDPIVEEVRRAGDAFFRKFNYDLKAALDDLRAKSEIAGRNIVSRPPKRVPEQSSQKLD